MVKKFIIFVMCTRRGSMGLMGMGTGTGKFKGRENPTHTPTRHTLTRLPVEYTPTHVHHKPQFKIC